MSEKFKNLLADALERGEITCRLVDAEELEQIRQGEADGTRIVISAPPSPTFRHTMLVKFAADGTVLSAKPAKRLWARIYRSKR